MFNRVVLNDHLTRWYHSSGYFVDRNAYDRYSTYRYQIYLSGAHKSGCALQVGLAKTLSDAKADILNRVTKPAEVSRG